MKKISFLLAVLLSISLPALLFASGSDEGTGAQTSSEAKGEAPMLYELVLAGELPPVEERLPSNPLVLEPLGGGEIGEYGGTVRLGLIVTWRSAEASGIAQWDTLIGYDYDLSTVVPIVAADWDRSDDGTTYTFTLREGMKWSDGHPFGVEDIRFWYEDALMNEELNPNLYFGWNIGGEPVQVEVVDDLTVRFIYAAPNPGAGLYDFTIGRGGGGGTPLGWRPYLPAHYLKNYHPDYVDPDELNARAAKAGFDGWVAYFDNANPSSWYDFGYGREIGIPTVMGFDLIQQQGNTFLLERNPYNWRVDTEGNQLPYIKRIHVTNVSNKEVLLTGIINGDYDYMRYNLSMDDYALLQENQEAGNYELIDDYLHDYVTAYSIRFNLTHDDPVIREVFQDFRFRKAMSIAINREEMVDLLFYGLGEPSQDNVHSYSKYYDPEIAHLHTEYDPEEANRLLDEIGLEWDARREWRLRPDGEPLTLVFLWQTARVQLEPAVELVSEYFREVGINVVPRGVDNPTWQGAAETNEFDFSMWPQSGAVPLILGNPTA